jgi:hypothetical protein
VEANAKNVRLGRAEANGILKEVSEVYAARGKKAVHVSLDGGKSAQEEALRLIIGPSGNLRAPALRAGKTLIAGYHEETYQKLFG